MAGEIITPILNRPNFSDVATGPKSLSKYNQLYGTSRNNIRADGTWSVTDEDGVRVLDHLYEVGKWGSSQTGMNEWAEFADGNTSNLPEVWYGFEFKFEAGFEYKISGKFYGIVCGGFGAGDGGFAVGGAGPASKMLANDQAGSMRIEPDGNMRMRFYIYDHLMTSTYGRPGNAGVFGQLIPGQWQKMAVRCVMNSPLTANNGLVQVWLDGVLIASETGIAWGRPELTSKGFQQVSVGTFFGGNDSRWASPKTQHMYQRSFFVWKTDNVKGNNLYTVNEEVNSPMGTLGVASTPPSAQVPQGITTITSVVAQTRTVTIQYSYSLVDESGFQYRLNGGPPEVLNNGIISNLSATTSYSLEIRAFNSTGEGAWSAPFTFLTLAADLAPYDIIKGKFKLAIVPNPPA